MRKLNLLPLFTLATLLSVVSCRKTESAKMPNDSTAAMTKTDSIPQTIYTTIDSAGTPLPGMILATPFSLKVAANADSSGLLLIMNQDGQIVKKKVTAGPAFDLNRWTINGQVRYSYIVNDPNALRSGGLDYDAGYVIIADSSLNTLQQVNFTPFGDTLFHTGQPLDVHDFILISDNDYITESYIIKPVTNIPSYVPHVPNELVAAPLIEEVQNGVVVWSWDFSADTSFYANSITGNNFMNADTAQDYVHLNSMTIDPRDNNLIISMRNQNQIIKINRQTGSVMWRLGGKNSDFQLTSNEIFLLQHHASLTDDNQTLMLFDDGDPVKRAYSRICEFQLDESNKLVTSFKAYTIPEPFTAIMGSVQKTGNEYFIGGGSGNYILEVNYVTGQKIMELKSPVYSTYRAFKY